MSMHSTGARGAFLPTGTDPPRARADLPARWSVRATWSRATQEVRPATLYRFVRNFYRDPLAWFGLVTSAVILAYGGGAAMFWLHAVYLGEGGPAISPVAHWALDSTAGFVGLSPAIAVIIPIAVWASTVGDRVSPIVYAIVGGVLFGLATAPGPILHDALVGRGTWVANHVTALIGNAGAPTTPGTDIPHITSICWQVAVGTPTYMLLTGLSLWTVRKLVLLYR
jgi:hypothetical protein